jgi:glycosyltransferase involved in cell wall biosynthesis
VWREHKNLPNLIRAFDILIKKYNFQGNLVLGGVEDPYYPETRNEWKKRGLENRVIRPGFLSGEKLNLLYQAADVFVLPSLYEGFGLVTIEALNQGTAVACSNIDPLKEVLKNASIYFDPHNPEDIANKLNILLQDKRLQIKLLMQAQGILEKYDWQEMAKKTLMIYKSVLENREHG